MITINDAIPYQVARIIERQGYETEYSIRRNNTGMAEMIRITRKQERNLIGRIKELMTGKNEEVLGEINLTTSELRINKKYQEEGKMIAQEIIEKLGIINPLIIN